MSKPIPGGKPVPTKKLDKAIKFAAAGAVGEVTRINANIRVELHRKLKAHAAVNGRTMGELIEEWIEGLPNIRG